MMQTNCRTVKSAVTMQLLATYLSATPQMSDDCSFCVTCYLSHCISACYKQNVPYVHCSSFRFLCRQRLCCCIPHAGIDFLKCPAIWYVHCISACYKQNVPYVHCSSFRFLCRQRLCCCIPHAGIDFLKCPAIWYVPSA